MMPGPAQRDQIWRNFATFAKNQILCNISTVYFLFGTMLSLLWNIGPIIGLIFIVANDQILKNNLTIWSHCLRLNQKFDQPELKTCLTLFLCSNVTI